MEDQRARADLAMDEPGGAVLVAVLVLALPTGAWAHHGAAIDRISWIAGAWKIDDSGRVIHEQWMEPLGGTMLGMSRTVKNG